MTHDELQEHVQVRHPDQPATGLQDGLHAAGRRHPEHAPGVQHQHARRRTATRRASARRRARYIAPANTRGLHPDPGGRLRAAATLCVRAPWFTRFDVGVTKQFPISGTTNFEVQVRRAERVRQHQLRSRSANPGTRRDDLPVTSGLHGSEQHLRSGRPPRPVHVPVQLVIWKFGDLEIWKSK